MDDSESFCAGSGVCEITPPLGVGLLMSSVEQRWAPFTHLRLPLFARAVVFERAGTRIAVVALDLLGLSGATVGRWRGFKARLSKASRGVVAPGNLVVAATHTHAAPESLGLTDLYRTTAFQEWLRQVERAIGEAVHAAFRAMRPCSLAVGSAQVRGLSVCRRLELKNGVLRNNTGAIQQGTRDGFVQDSNGDSQVNVAAVLDLEGRVMAIMVNAACHPVHEMCLHEISSDYPGEMAAALERSYPGAVTLFLNGAAGNLDPAVVSGGAEGARQHGRQLAEAVEKALAESRPVDVQRMVLRRKVLRLPARLANGAPARDLTVGLTSVGMGSVAFVFLPGEPFMETGLAIRGSASFEWVFTVGYSENMVGYIPTNRAYDEHAYEAGPGLWVPLARGCEPVVREAAKSLLYETFLRVHCSFNGSHRVQSCPHPGA